MKEININYDLLRIIDTLSVMLLHIATATMWTNYENTFNWYVVNSYVTILHWVVPCFVMISGMIFLNPNKKISIKTLYSKYIKRIIVAYLFWSALYSIYDIIAYGGSIKTFITSTFNGHFHLGYLVMLIGLYMITPMIKKSIENMDKKTYEYWLLLGCIFTIAIPLIRKVKLLDTVLEQNLETIGMGFVTGYIFYYLLGYYLYKYDVLPKQRRAIYITTIITTIFCIFINNFFVMNLENRIYLLGPFDISSLSISVSMFLLAKYNFNNLLNNKMKKYIVMISEVSFTMYLVHDFINLLFYRINFKNDLFNSILSVPIIGICVFILSFIVSLIIKKVSVKLKIQKNIIVREMKQ